MMAQTQMAPLVPPLPPLPPWPRWRRSWSWLACFPWSHAVARSALWHDSMFHLQQQQHHHLRLCLLLLESLWRWVARREQTLLPPLQDAQSALEHWPPICATQR